MIKLDKSKEIFEQSKDVVPAGTSSNYRGYPTWDPHPISIKKGKGCRIEDADGNEYIDMFLSFGPMILGHSHPKITEAVKQQLENSSMTGTISELEADAADKICDMVPCADMVRFTNSGTESTMHALRVARAYTGKNKILKFEGNYHGMHDYGLTSVYPPAEYEGLETSPHGLRVPGVPKDVLNTVIVSSWNRPKITEEIVERNANDLAAIILEPVSANMGVIPPEDGFLETLREVCDRNNVLLIFDEVQTGFRLAQGGAQEYFGITPDMATYAKAVGGGLPIGAFAGKREIMKEIKEEGISHGGTYNANPVCTAASNAVLDELGKNDGEAFDHIHKVGNRIMDGIRDEAEDAGQDVLVQGIGPMFQMYFTEENDKLINWREVRESIDFEKFEKFAWECIERGVYIFPSAPERNFVCTEHSMEDGEEVIEKVGEALRALD